MYNLICESIPTINIDGLPECANGWITQTATLAFDVSQIDPAVAGQYFAGGFVLIIPVWAAGVGVQHLLRLIRF